jgi:hypothetical protein
LLNLALIGQGNGTMKTLTLAALAMSLCIASPAYAEKPTNSQTELIDNLAVITASVDRCHFETDSRIIGLVLLKELILIEDTLAINAATQEAPDPSRIVESLD